MTAAAPPILLRRDAAPGIAVLTLNRSDKLNALSYALVDALAAAVVALDADPAVRAVILTGAGRAFSAGADIPEFRESLIAGSATAVEAFCRRGQRMTAAIENSTTPVIAAVNGPAYGGGCEIVEATHLAIAARGATFAKPEIGLGIMPTFGGTQRLARLAGRKRALHALLTGDPFDAPTAVALGLVNAVVPDAALLASAVAAAQRIVRHPALAVGATLAATTRGLNAPIDDGLAIEAAQFARLAAGTQWREPVAAFVERRRTAPPGQTP